MCSHFPSPYPKVAVVGMGYVGSCVAAVLAQRGCTVTGIDVDPKLVAELNTGYCRHQEKGLADLIARHSGGRLRVTQDMGAVADQDVVIIAVGTPIRHDGTLEEGQLRAACEAIGQDLEPGTLVILKSTVPPGTTRGPVTTWLQNGGLRCGSDFRLAFCPERLSEGRALEELRTLPMVVGGWCSSSTDAGRDFWKQALGVDTLIMNSLEGAELVKLADNWWIDTNIALANELARLCVALDVDTLDVIEAANTLEKGTGRVNILLPSVGVGGSCLTKDPWMVDRAAREHGFTLRTVAASREANDEMPLYMAERILDGLVRSGKDPQGARVAILGLAYKNDTGDLRETPVAAVIKRLIDAGVDVAVHDPLVSGDQAEKILGMYPQDSYADAVTDADCVAFLAYHRQFASIDLQDVAGRMAPPRLLVDGRAYFDKETVERMRALGLVYLGFGR